MIVAAGRCPHCGSVPNYWNANTVIAALQAWTNEHGRTPRATDWHYSAPERPTKSCVTGIFGSWNNALRAAGLPVRKQGGGRCYWTRDTVADAMLDWLLEHGSWPQTRDWERGKRPGGKRYPSRSAVIRLFGNWDAAKKHAGFVHDGYRSAGNCKSCGCRKDERTPGCQSCRTRHAWRSHNPKRVPTAPVVWSCPGCERTDSEDFTSDCRHCQDRQRKRTKRGPAGHPGLPSSAGRSPDSGGATTLVKQTVPRKRQLTTARSDKEGV